MEPLEVREKEVLDFIKKEVARCNYPPSVREICQALAIRSTSTVHGCLESLENKGYIRRGSTKPRAIEILEQSAADMSRRCFFAPLIGRITAGQPVLAEENLEGYFPIPPEIAPGGSCFVLRVDGDSMSGAGILNGDFVIVRQQKTAENGEIAAVMLNDEATVKRFYQEKESFRLQPENEAYKPIYTNDLEILGKVVGIFRRL
ncbi:MAG: transcriptional repressor LexA [Bacillota bacterium]